MQGEQPPHLSIIIPILDEEESIDPLLDELIPVLATIDGGYEVIVVDDGSTDSTPARLRHRLEVTPHLRVLTLTPHSGQTAAFEAGFRAGRGALFVTLDGDGQNDPADIPRLLAALEGMDAVFGVRAHRSDPGVRRFAKRVADLVRNLVLRSQYRDVGCSLKVFRRDIIAGVTLYNGLHRFFPYLVEMRGGRAVEIEVSHRPRRKGRSKVRPLARGWPAFWDLFMVRRMRRRSLRYDVTEMH